MMESTLGELEVEVAGWERLEAWNGTGSLELELAKESAAAALVLGMAGF